ncbi:MAG: MarR family transcriptional regulator [Candidatus Cloacimonetes bacterium]|nr:MarR family transcriptional regulator [Candidatus Cloacimonadota bacterium]
MKRKSVERLSGLYREMQGLFNECDLKQRGCVNIGRMECSLLQYLYKGDKPTCMNDLSIHLCVSHSRITRIVDNLVKKELVQRYPSEKDRRRWYSEITEKGKLVARQSEVDRVNLLERIFDGVPNEKRNELTSYLDAFVQAFRNAITEKEKLK